MQPFSRHRKRTRATTKEGVFCVVDAATVAMQRRSKHSFLTIERLCFLRGSYQRIKKKQGMSIESVEFSDARLPRYELWSRGIELRHQYYWVQFVQLTVGLRRKDFTCAVMQWECYSSCIKIRNQETDSGDYNRQRTLLLPISVL
jgi:hypothetical protein